METREDTTYTIAGEEYRVLEGLTNLPASRTLLVEASRRRMHLRLISGGHAEEVEQRGRKLRELAAAGAGMVAPLEVGESDGLVYALRAWVDAEPFDAFARGFKFSPKRQEHPLNVGVKLCRAVEGLHHARLIHGALKNSNIFFERDGSAVVTDPVLVEDALKKADPRDDVRALGLLLCRLYTGKPELAIDGYTLMMLAKAKVPRQLLRVLWQAIHEEPSMRFPDAATLGRALREVPLPEYQRTVQVRALPDNIGPTGGLPNWLRNTAIVVGVLSLTAVASWFLGSNANFVGSRVAIPDSSLTSGTAAPPDASKGRSGVSVTDLRVGSGAILETGDYSRVRLLAQRVSQAGHRFKDWRGEAEVSLLLSPDGPQVAAVWQSLVGMREGGVRRIVIGPPESNELTGVRGGEAFRLPAGTVWEYEVEALATLPQPRSQVGIRIDTESKVIGAMVTDVVGEPARQAGLAPGDLISSIDGVEVGSGQHGMRLFRLLEPQVPVRLLVSRGGAELELTIVPLEAPPQGKPDRPPESGALWIGGDAVLP